MGQNDQTYSTETCEGDPVLTAKIVSLSNLKLFLELYPKLPLTVSNSDSWETFNNMLKAYKSIFGPFKEIMANAGIPGEPAQFERALNSIHYPSMLAQPEERHNEPDVFGAISITAPGEPTSTPFPQTPNPQIIYSLSFLLPPGWGEMGIPINLLYLPADEIPNQPDKVQFRRTEVFSV